MASPNSRKKYKISKVVRKPSGNASQQRSGYRSSSKKKPSGFLGYLKSLLMLFAIFVIICFLAADPDNDSESIFAQNIPVFTKQLSYIFSSGPLPLDYNSEIKIQDELGIINNTTDLKKELIEFQEKTGITINIITCKYQHKIFMNQSVNKQASEYYKTNYNDESHWLIYYTDNTAESLSDKLLSSDIMDQIASDKEIENRTVNLKDPEDEKPWALVTGKDCPLIISRAQEKEFKKELQKYLDLKTMPFEDAVILSLKNVKISDKKINFGNIGYEPGPTVLVILFAILVIKILIRLIKNGVISIIHNAKDYYGRYNKNTVSTVHTDNMAAITGDNEHLYIICPQCSTVYNGLTSKRCPECAKTEELNAKNQNNHKLNIK